MDTLAELAAFLLARTTDVAVSDADQLRVRGILEGYYSGSARVESVVAMRAIASRFRDHADYRVEWSQAGARHRVTGGEQASGSRRTRKEANHRR